MFRIIPTVIAFAVVLLAGVVPGLWSGRWGESAEFKAAVARLQDIPKTLGDWQAPQEREIPAKHLEIGEINGYKYRVYVNRQTGTELTVLLVCGKPGPIAVHTPDVCFAGLGRRPFGPQAKQTVQPPDSGPAAEFWQLDFVRLVAGVMVRDRVFWAWNAQGVWTAADDARWQFGGAPFLYKLYVYRTVEEDEEDPEPCIEFMRELLPALQKALFADAPRGSGNQGSGNQAIRDQRSGTESSVLSCRQGPA
jgi:Protein of unknown function (DUF3485)